MSRTQVEAVLGSPGDYRTVPTDYVFRAPIDIFTVELTEHPDQCDAGRDYTGRLRLAARWAGNEGAIQIEFESGVAAATFRP